MFFDVTDQHRWSTQKSALYQALDSSYGQARLDQVHAVITALGKLQKKLLSEHKKYYKIQGLSTQQCWDKVRTMTDRFLMRPEQGLWSRSVSEVSVVEYALNDLVEHSDGRLWALLAQCIDVHGCLSDGHYAIEHLMRIGQQKRTIQGSVAPPSEWTAWIEPIWNATRQQLKVKECERLCTRWCLYACTLKIEAMVEYWIRAGANVNQPVHVVLGQDHLSVKRLQLNQVHLVWDMTPESKVSVSSYQRRQEQLQCTVPLWHYALSVRQCAPLWCSMEQQGKPKSHSEHWEVLRQMVYFKNSPQNIDRFCECTIGVSWFEPAEQSDLKTLIQQRYQDWETQKDGAQIQALIQKHAARWQAEHLGAQLGTVGQGAPSVKRL